jgi:chromosomal replication initiation ATPase DnaA
MYLIRVLMDEPYQKIGAVFGDAHHTTVMNGEQKVEKLLKTDTFMQQAIAELKKRLKTA